MRNLSDRIRTSVRYEILAVFIVGIVLPILVSSWLSYRISTRAINAHSLEHQKNILLEISRGVWTREDQFRRQLAALATDPGVVKQLEAGSVAEPTLRAFLRLNPDWADLQVIDSRGRTVWPQTRGQETNVVDPFFLDTFVLHDHQTPVFIERGRPMTRFGYRVDSASDFLGVISASLDLSTLRRELRQVRNLSSLRALVWDDRGIVFGSNLKADEEKKLREAVDLGSAGTAIADAPDQTIHRRIRFEDAEFVFSATNVPEFVRRIDPIAGQEWFVGILTPASSAFAELSSFQSRVLVFMCGLFALVAGAFIVIGRRVSRPLEQMAIFAGDVARGRRDVKLPAQGGGREVNQLGDALNSMAGSLQAYEKELVRQESMASLGRMSSVLAHEIRNPLNAVKGSAQVLALRYPDEPLIQDYTNIIVRKVDTLSRFIQSLLHAARLPDPDRKPVVCSQFLGRALEACRLQAEAQGTVIEIECPEQLTLRGDEEQLGELVQNLVQNSLEAVRQGGTIEIRVREERGRLVIEFRDNGPGLPAAVRERLFVPFVTGRRSGTGLGLFLSRMVAENHGGSLEYVHPEKGACFLLRLPVESGNE